VARRLEAGRVPVSGEWLGCCYFTVTETDAEVREFPATSVATAVRECVLREAEAVFQLRR
jgi:hypothetical protein